MFKKIIILVPFALVVFVLAVTLTSQFNVASANYNQPVKYTSKKVRQIRYANLNKVREMNLQRYQLYNRLQQGNNKQTKREINRLSSEINKINRHLDKPYVY